MRENECDIRHLELITQLVIRVSYVVALLFKQG